MLSYHMYQFSRTCRWIMDSEAEAVIVQGKPLHLFGKDYLKYHPLTEDYSQAQPQWNICNR